MNSSRSTTISFHLPADLKAAAKVAAIRAGLSLQEVVQQALRADARIAAELPTIPPELPAPPAAARAPRAPRQRRK